MPMTTKERLDVAVQILEEIDHQRERRHNPFYALGVEKQTIDTHLAELAEEWRASGVTLPKELKNKWREF